MFFVNLSKVWRTIVALFGFGHGFKTGGYCTEVPDQDQYVTIPLYGGRTRTVKGEGRNVGRVVLWDNPNQSAAFDVIGDEPPKTSETLLMIELRTAAAFEDLAISLGLLDKRTGWAPNIWCDRTTGEWYALGVKSQEVARSRNYFHVLDAIMLYDYLEVAKVHYPGVGDQYEHRNGIPYEVDSVTNTFNTSGRPEYPVYVTYQGANGKTWTKTLLRFLQTMHLTCVAKDVPHQPCEEATDWEAKARNMHEQLQVALDLANERRIERDKLLNPVDQNGDALALDQWWVKELEGIAGTLTPLTADQYRACKIAVNMAKAVLPATALCQDEGCPHAGTDHVCVDLRQEKLHPLIQTLRDNGEEIARQATKMQLDNVYKVTCPDCNGRKEKCMAGCSAHPDNWYDCETCKGEGMVDAKPFEEFRPVDLNIYTYSSKPKSGFVHQVDDGVAIQHRPTGLEARSHSERTSHANRLRALTELRKMVDAIPADPVGDHMFDRFIKQGD
jgi:hypothetical protein